MEFTHKYLIENNEEYKRQFVILNVGVPPGVVHLSDEEVLNYQFPKMDAAIKDRWLADLRSDKFTQSKQALRQDIQEKEGEVKYGYCCLGVLLLQEDEVNPDFRWIEAGYTLDPEKCYPTEIAFPCDKTTIYSRMGLGYQHYSFIAQLNDALSWSFEQIANWIEVNL